MATKKRGSNYGWPLVGATICLALMFAGAASSVLAMPVGPGASSPDRPIGGYSPPIVPTSTFTITPTPVPTCGVFWRGFSSPNAANENFLSAVAALSPYDAWAVGYHDNWTPTPLIIHWDGTQWSVMTSPNITRGFLEGVAGTSPNDVWAVGWTGSHPNQQTLIMHWDGSAWSVVPSPNIGSGDNTLYGVTAISSNDAWAVGYYYDASAGHNQTLTLHWRGASWIIVPSPNVSGVGDNRLDAISYSSANDVWAVGRFQYQPGTQSVILHWDGTQWSMVPGLGEGYLAGIVALAADDAWAVGGGGTGGQLAMHWDGAQWSAVSTPPVPGGQGFDAVSATSSNDVWAVGNTYDGVAEHTLIEHWDGTSWARSPSPSLGTIINFLYGVAAFSPTEAWAVGYYSDGGGSAFTQVLRYYDPCAPTTPTLTPTPTNTPTPTATFTITPAATSTYAPTSTPTNTPCSVSTPFTEGFESGSLNTFTSQVAQCSTGGCGWSAVSNSQHSGVYSAFAPNVSSISDQRLVLNTPVVIPADASAATLSFWHKHVFDADGGNYYDGSVLEFSIDGGVSWTDVLSSTNFISGGYDGVIVFGHFNPLARRQAWGGYNASYPNFDRVVVNLSPLAGQSVLFRFRIGTDHVVGAQGWWVDDIAVNVAEDCPAALLTGHVTWQGPPPQPATRQQLPITLTLKLGNTEVNYPRQTTDASGYFTASVGGLPAGTYQWRAKGPIYLANAGAVTLTGSNVGTFERWNVSTTSVEMGLMRAGDCNNDNIVNLIDFNIMKNTFGKGIGDPGYDARADFNNDSTINIADVNLQKINFGQGGAPPIGP